MLENLIQFLETHNRAHTLFPVFLDLIASLRDRLRQVTDTLPSAVKSWDGVGQTASRLDGLALVLNSQQN
jgi:hypothetical protein